MTLFELSQIIGVNLTATQRAEDEWGVDLEGVEIVCEHTLESFFARGPTVEAAKNKLAKRLVGETIKINAGLETEKEFKVPDTLAV